MAKLVFVLLNGDESEGVSNHFQLLEGEVARAQGERLGLVVETAFAPAFDQWRVLKRRVSDPQLPKPDAIVVEPANFATLDLIARRLRGEVGLVLLNIWGGVIEEQAANWGALPFGSVSTDHARVGFLQGLQVRALLPKGARILCVTGPTFSSAAQERLMSLRAELGRDYEIQETAAPEWTEHSGGAALQNWYRLARTRDPGVAAVVAQADELAMGARQACRELADAAHRARLSAAHFIGVDACPAYGRQLVDTGKLRASITTAANAGLAMELLYQFWSQGKPLPLRSFTDAQPYPASSAPAWKNSAAAMLAHQTLARGGAAPLA